MINPIDPAQFKDKPSRPLKEIVEDILYYPLDLPEGTLFDRSMLVRGATGENFMNMLNGNIKNADSILKNSSIDTTNLIDRIQGKLPALNLEPVTTAGERSPDVQLAYSAGPLAKLRNSLQKIEQGGEGEKSDKEVIKAALYKAVALNLQYYEKLVAEAREAPDSLDIDLLAHLTRKDAKAAEADLQKDNENDIKLFETTTHNLRRGVMPLLDELAAALGITLDKKMAMY